MKEPDHKQQLKDQLVSKSIRMVDIEEFACFIDDEIGFEDEEGGE